MWLTHFWHSWSQFFIFAWDVTAGGILRTGVLICLVATLLRFSSGRRNLREPDFPTIWNSSLEWRGGMMLMWIDFLFQVPYWISGHMSLNPEFQDGNWNRELWIFILRGGGQWGTCIFVLAPLFAYCHWLVYDLINRPRLSNASVNFSVDPVGPFYKHVLTLIPAWIGNYIHYKVWDEITYQFLNFSGAAVEV